MGDLVFHVQIGIVAGVSLPHLPDDLDPSLAKAAQRLGMAFAFFAQRGVVGFGPDAVLGAFVREEVHGVAQAAVAGTADLRLFDLATLEAHRRCACDAW